MFLGHAMRRAAAGHLNRAVTIAFTDQTSSTTDLTTYTFSSRAIGDAAGDRKVVVAAVGQRVSASIASVTVGGISASLVIAQPVNDGSRTVELWQAAVPTGTTADIVVTFNTGASAHCGIGVWAVYGAGSAAHDTLGSIASPGTGTIDVPGGGVLIGATMDNSVDGSVVWSAGPTEDFDANINDGGGESNTSGASASYPSAQTGLTVTVAYSGTSPPTRQAMAAASWGSA
jgi:hypothetical protein